MYQNFKQSKASTFEAMETGDHSKNGASLKSLTSKRNFFGVNKGILFMVFVGISLLVSSCASTYTPPPPPQNKAQVTVSPGVQLSKQIPIVVVKNESFHVYLYDEKACRMEIENALQANGYKVVSSDLIGQEDYPTIDVLMEKLKYPTVYFLEWIWGSRYDDLTVKLTDKKTGISVMSGKSPGSSGIEFLTKNLVEKMNDYFR
jgi:hypothetical protein